MELPPEIVSIIKEYSMPLTKANWRTLHKMTESQFHGVLIVQYATEYTEIDDFYFYTICIKHIKPFILYTFLLPYLGNI